MSEIMKEKREYSIPKKCFDMEYATQWKKEVEYLYSVGIRPTFTKRDKEYGVITYKYRKTMQLFAALAVFYDQLNNSKQLDSVEAEFKQCVYVINVNEDQAEIINGLVQDFNLCNGRKIADTIEVASQVCEV